MAEAEKRPHAGCLEAGLRFAGKAIDEPCVLDAARAQDESAVRYIFRVLEAPLRGFIRRMLGGGGEEEVSSIYAHVMCDFWLAAPRFQGRSSVKTFIFAIARRQCAAALKKRTTGLHEIPFDYERDAASPFDPAQELRMQLRAAIATLTKAEQRVIKLHFFGRLTCAEIGRQDKMKAWRVRKLLREAIMKLRAMLGAGS